MIALVTGTGKLEVEVKHNSSLKALKGKQWQKSIEFELVTSQLTPDIGTFKIPFLPQPTGPQIISFYISCHEKEKYLCTRQHFESMPTGDTTSTAPP